MHQWLVDKEHSDEKEAALHTLWSETDGKADAGTWASLSNVYNKIGAGQQKLCENSECRYGNMQQLQ